MSDKLIEEMFEKLWTQYPADLCKGKRGGRQPAFKAFKKINPDETEFKRIMVNMKAMIRADRGDKDSYRWPFVSSYLNQARYDDFILPACTTSSPEQLEVCSVDSCNKKVHGQSFKFCSFHIPNNFSDKIKKAFEETGLDYTSPTFTDDCRAYCRTRMNLMLGKVQ